VSRAFVVIEAAFFAALIAAAIFFYAHRTNTQPPAVSITNDIWRNSADHQQFTQPLR
jgi:hypothetical protein